MARALAKMILVDAECTSRTLERRGFPNRAARIGWAKGGQSKGKRQAVQVQNSRNGRNGKHDRNERKDGKEALQRVRLYCDFIVVVTS